MESFLKNTHIQRKNRLNRSLDEGDIVDSKFGRFLERFVTIGQMKWIGVLAKDMYEFEVQEACKALRSKENFRDLVVQRKSKLPLKMQAEKKQSKTIVEAFTHGETSSRGEF